MKSQLVHKLNSLFKMQDAGNNLIHEINEIISQMTWIEQLDLHSKVEPVTLKGLYKHIDKINVGADVKEHIVWFYYARLFQRTNALIEDSILNQILNDYIKFRFGALESLVIDLIRHNQISLEQINKAWKVMRNNELNKQYHIYKTKKDVDNGIILEVSDVNKLMELKAFNALEYVLEKKAIKKDALYEFKRPEKGEKDRKIKEILFKKAQELVEGARIVKIDYPTPHLYK